MPNKLNIKVYSLINVIDLVMTLAILKTKLFSKSVPGFDKECKEI